MNKEQQSKLYKAINHPLVKLTAVGLIAVGCGRRAFTPTVSIDGTPVPNTPVPAKVTPEASKPTQTPPKPTAVPTPVITLKVPDTDAYVSRFSDSEITVHTKDTLGTADKNLPEAIKYMLEYNCSIENIRPDSFRFWRVNLKNPAACMIFKAPEGLARNGKRYREDISGDYTRIIRMSRVDFLIYANSGSDGADAYLPEGLVHLQRSGCQLESYLLLSFRVLLVGVKDSDSCARHLAFN